MYFIKYWDPEGAFTYYHIIQLQYLLLIHNLPYFQNRIWDNIKFMCGGNTGLKVQYLGG